MAQAYRHQGLGSTKQLSSYIRQRLRELNELMERSTNEGEMWKSLGERPDLPTSVSSYLHRRRDKLGERYRTDRGECEMLEELLEWLRDSFCKTCDGSGDIGYQNECDEVRCRTCEDCGGTGEK